MDDTKLKRAGLDYWSYVVVKIHDYWEGFHDYFLQRIKEVASIYKEGNKNSL